MNDEAVLSNDNRFTSFTYNNRVIRFKTSSKLERYTKIIEWNKGYIVVMAVYNGVEVEESFPFWKTCASTPMNF